MRDSLERSGDIHGENLSVDASALWVSIESLADSSRTLWRVLEIIWRVLQTMSRVLETMWRVLETMLTDAASPRPNLHKLSTKRKGRLAGVKRLCGEC